jgi:acetate kinase
MDKAILVLNTGSSSIKFAIFITAKADTRLDLAVRGQIAGIGQQAQFLVERVNGSRVDKRVVDSASLHNHEVALHALLEWVQTFASSYVFIAVGHRVVHGGTIFSSPTIVDAGVFAQLESLVPLAPMHQPHNLAAIDALNRIDPDLLQVACFDTAFHRSMPAVAQSFALPRTLTAEGVRPYGFHGLSYEYIASVLPDDEKSGADSRVIVAHLGHGASLCAMIGCRSVATSMTFTPLDGLPMATRCGSLDPGVLLYLMTEKGMSVDAVTDLLHNKSGLLGISGVSGDMRELLASSDPHSAEAIELFVYRVVRELGSLAAALGGLDRLVFTGGIGAHSNVIRERICQQLGWLGVQISSSANIAGAQEISEKDSPVSVWAIPTDEELIIAQHAYAITQSMTSRN